MPAMTPQRSRTVFLALASAIAWGGFALSHRADERRQEESFQRLQDFMAKSQVSQRQLDGEMEAIQRRLGCKGEVAMGICMDPPCVASGPIEPRYVRGSVTFYEPMAPHRTVEDTCVGPSDLREGTCKVEQDGGVARPEWQVVHCDKGCREGACVR
jgi:hypothetical protein